MLGNFYINCTYTTLPVSLISFSQSASLCMIKIYYWYLNSVASFDLLVWLFDYFKSLTAEKIMKKEIVMSGHGIISIIGVIKHGKLCGGNQWADPPAITVFIITRSNPSSCWSQTHQDAALLFISEAPIWPAFWSSDLDINSSNLPPRFNFQNDLKSLQESSWWSFNLS